MKNNKDIQRKCGIGKQLWIYIKRVKNYLKKIFMQEQITKNVLYKEDILSTLLTISKPSRFIDVKLTYFFRNDR